MNALTQTYVHPWSGHALNPLDPNLVQTLISPHETHKPGPHDRGGLNLHPRTKPILALGSNPVLESWSQAHGASHSLLRHGSTTPTPTIFIQVHPSLIKSGNVLLYTSAIAVCPDNPFMNILATVNLL